MEILEMIAEWKTGCTCAIPEHPEECTSCTVGLIDAIENREKEQSQRGCVTDKFYLIIDRLREAASIHPKSSQQRGLGENRLVLRTDIEAMMREFFRLDAQLRRLHKNSDIEVEEEHRVT